MYYITCTGTRCMANNKRQYLFNGDISALTMDCANVTDGAPSILLPFAEIWKMGFGQCVRKV